MKSIQELLEQDRQAQADEIADRQTNHITTLEFIQRNFPAWRKWYLKKNQQKNYFRVTRVIPPGCEERPGTWIHKFQIWIKGELDQEYNIDALTYNTYYHAQGWEQDEHSGMEYAILRPAKPQ